MSLKDYLDLDFSVASPAGEALFSELTRDNGNTLSPPYSDGIPAYLTTGMAVWYNQHVHPCRVGALHAINRTFNDMNSRKAGRHGIFLELEMDSADRVSLERIREERALFQQRQDITKVYEDLNEQRQKYNDMQLDYGEALKWKPFRYWSVLIFMIVILEGFINIESFLAIPGFTPALSTGSFLVVSCAFAVSAHLVGMLIKQRRERLGGAVRGHEKRNNVLLFGAALVMFGLAFMFVVYARWSLLGDLILVKSQTTGEGLGWEELLRFGGSLIGNVIVYLMGIVWSYIRHDLHPGFSELRDRVEILEGRFSKLLSRELAQRTMQHLHAAQEEKLKLRNLDRQLSTQLPGYRDCRDMVNQLRQQDARVAALLEKYKAALLERVLSEHHPREFRFVDITKAAIDTGVSITAERYATIPIELRFII